MKDYTKWTRLNLERAAEKSLNETDPKRRTECERQTNNDVRKPIQQLICDVHEECSTPGFTDERKLVESTKRMVSMMGRVALEHEEVGKDLVKLTKQLYWLTLALVALGVVALWPIIDSIIHHGK